MASRYAWVITKDNLFPPGEWSDEGTIGPRGAELDAEEIREEGEGFKMFDDDGEFLYHGYITGDYDGFEPLDDFGTPNAGATEIRYRGTPGGPSMWQPWEAL